MSTNRISAALRRKLGPLPAWVWLTFFAVGVIVYRRMHKVTDAISTTGEVVDDTSQSRDPVTVAPGEGVYDPNTGQFKSQAPDQIKLDPITVEPGEAIYDPQTGKFIRNVPPPKKHKKKHKPKHKPKHHYHPHGGHTRDLNAHRHHHRTPHHRPHPHHRRTPKHKPQHSNTHGKVARQPASGATRTRLPATIMNAAARIPARALAPFRPAPSAVVAHEAGGHSGPPATTRSVPTPTSPAHPAVSGPGAGFTPSTGGSGAQSVSVPGAPRPRTTVNPTVQGRARTPTPAPHRAPVKAHPAASGHAPAKSAIHGGGHAAPPAPKTTRRR